MSAPRPVGGDKNDISTGIDMETIPPCLGHLSTQVAVCLRARIPGDQERCVAAYGTLVLGESLPSVSLFQGNDEGKTHTSGETNAEKPDRQRRTGCSSAW